MLLSEKESKLMFVILIGLVAVTTIFILMLKGSWVQKTRTQFEECLCNDCMKEREKYR